MSGKKIIIFHNISTPNLRRRMLEGLVLNLGMSHLKGCERATSYENSEAFSRFSYNKCSVQGLEFTTMDLLNTAFTGSHALTTVHFCPSAVHRLLARLEFLKGDWTRRCFRSCLEGMRQGTCKDAISAICFQHGVPPGKVFHDQRQIQVIKGGGRYMRSFNEMPDPEIPFATSQKNRTTPKMPFYDTCTP